MEFAVVDIETTGGSGTYHKIVEIAIVITDGYQILESWSTLIHPERSIPPNVALIHGISEDMVKDAPKYYEVAEKIWKLTENRIFVAHSVQFDYGFVKSEFGALGADYQRARLCTVRLSKKVWPGHSSYSLGNLCRDRGIRISQRHRALGDAQATAQLLIQMHQHPDFTVILRQHLHARSKEISLPPHLDKKQYSALPPSVGVYLFHDQHGKVLYVGKATNIKDRVTQHFGSHTHTKNRSYFIENIHGVSYEETGSELLALLLENEYIKKYYPRYNKLGKSFQLNYGIYQFEDRLGFARLVVGEVGKRSQALASFGTKSAALNQLIKTSMQYGLCLKLNHVLQADAPQCHYEHTTGLSCGYCGGLPTSEYNERVHSAVHYLKSGISYLVCAPGRVPEESGAVLVKKGKIVGMGYLPYDLPCSDLEEVSSLLTPLYDTQDSHWILQQFLKQASVVRQEPLILKI